MPPSSDSQPSDVDSSPVSRAPVLYVTDLAFAGFDPADLFDLAFLLRSTRHELTGICLTNAMGDGQRVLDNLTTVAGATVPYVVGTQGLADALIRASEPLNLFVVGGYDIVTALIAENKPLVREKVARIFVVGGFANDYSRSGDGERLPDRVGLPIDPRLKERNPERFASHRFDRLPDAERVLALGRLLTSGEGIIWLPRDICLWRYAAPQILMDGGPLCEFLLRELFWTYLQDETVALDRYYAADAPVLLSSLPGLLLATQPDPFAWMRLFRVVPARVEITDAGTVDSIETRTEAPNLYAVIAIDGQSLGKVLTNTLRIRPLAL